MIELYSFILLLIRWRPGGGLEVEYRNIEHPNVELSLGLGGGVLAM